MATNTAPLLSFSASGQVAKTQVYSHWRGVPYVRKYVVPANPQTAGQTETRSVFTWLSNIWKNSGSLQQAPWTLFTAGQPLYNRNSFMGKNIKVLRPGTTTTAFIGSPGAKGGLAPTSIAVTPGANQLTVAFTNPTAPTGWTLAAAVAMAVLNADPHTSTTYTTVAGEDDTTFNSVVLTGLAASLYTVSAWLQWTKPDGTTAYGVSINATATPT